jgi:hypothetical protein
MKLELFPTTVFQERLASHELNVRQCEPVLETLFHHCESNGIAHTLEVGASVTTFPVERTLFNEPAFRELCDEIVALVARCTKFRAEFIEMWANRHRRESFTLEHMHGAHVCGAYYLRFPPGSGRLIFRSPLEYTTCGCLLLDSAEGAEAVHAMDIKAGEVVLFPGWLKHFTEPSRSDGDRIVISFNMRVVGTADG